MVCCGARKQVTLPTVPVCQPVLHSLGEGGRGLIKVSREEGGGVLPKGARLGQQRDTRRSGTYRGCIRRRGPEVSSVAPVLARPEDRGGAGGH